MNLGEALNLSNANLSLGTVVINFLVTFLLAFIIYQVYRLTYTGVAYSKNFNVAIVFTSIVTSMVMMVIGNNLALSLGMVGALSIVRFRSAIKEAKDIGFLFWGIAVGLAAGTGAYGIAIVGTIILSIVALIFQFNIGGETRSFLLVVKGQGMDNKAITGMVSSLTKSYKLRMKNTSNKMNEVVYEVKIKKNSEDDIVEGVQKISGVELVNVVAYNGNITG